MKVSFFLLKFPLASETFVLNQIVAFIEMGHDVEIIALQKGDLTNTHAAYTKYRLAEKVRWLQDEPPTALAKLRYRGFSTLCGLHRPTVWRALNMQRYGQRRVTSFFHLYAAVHRRPLRLTCLSHTLALRASRRRSYVSWK